MTFVSALFSRTHLNANCFAVLNESFKVISLFSYQSSLFCCCSATFISYQISKCLSTTFLTFFKVICFCCIAHATACIYYHKHLRLSTTFFFHFQFYFLIQYIFSYLILRLSHIINFSVILLTTKNTINYTVESHHMLFSPIASLRLKHNNLIK